MALITEQTSGPERRTAFATQQVAATGGSSLGMLSGGAVIALIGAGATMHVAGVVLIAMPLLLIARECSFPRRHRGRRDPAGLDEANRDESASLMAIRR